MALLQSAVSGAVLMLAALYALPYALVALLSPGVGARPQWPGVEQVAHRCGLALAPENTLEALEVAVRHGAKAVEFDVQITADGEAVVFHDPVVNGLTDGRGRVGDLTLAQVRALRVVPKNTTFFVPEYKAMAQPVRIPTLREMVTAAVRANQFMVIESKEFRRKHEMRDTLLALFREFDLYARAVVGSFDPQLLYMVRSAEPRISTLLFSVRSVCQHLCPRQQAQEQRSRESGDPFAPTLPWFLCSAPMLWDALLDWAHADWLPRLVGASVLGRHWSDVSRQYIESWRAQGLVTNAWVVNSRPMKEALARLGAIVTTDCPGAVDCELGETWIV
jgi:glycerophosphoryl diester phosphodiesterase